MVAGDWLRSTLLLAASSPAWNWSVALLVTLLLVAGIAAWRLIQGQHAPQAAQPRGTADEGRDPGRACGCEPPLVGGPQVPKCEDSTCSETARHGHCTVCGGVRSYWRTEVQRGSLAVVVFLAALLAALAAGLGGAAQAILFPGRRTGITRRGGFIMAGVITAIVVALVVGVSAGSGQFSFGGGSRETTALPVGAPATGKTAGQSTILGGSPKPVQVPQERDDGEYRPDKRDDNPRRESHHENDD